MISDKKIWKKNAIIYHVLIDRFAGFGDYIEWKKPLFLGGNIKGIIRKIPYLKKLGINTLWISPFYQSNMYHGYHITDFFQVDRHFGSISDIEKLIESVHDERMNIIADFVPNHCSNQHPYFIDASKNFKSEYRKWFYFIKWPESYLCFLSFKDLPKLNLNNPETRNHIIEAANYWLSFGFDGFRLDHVIGPPDSFWKYFISKIKVNFPNAIFIGEAWMQGIKFYDLKTIMMNRKYLKWLRGKSSDYLLESYEKIFDGVLDFYGQQLIQKYGFNEKYSDTDILKILNNHYKKFNYSYFLPLFLDNHDMDRILFKCGNNKDLLKKIVRIQFSVNQPIIIYYGTEIGMSQTHSIFDQPSHGDLLAREPMKWNKIDDELFLFYQNLCHQRNFKIPILKNF